MFPFYPEPLTGHAALLPAQCGENLEFVSDQDGEGWTLRDFEPALAEWLKTFWHEAIHGTSRPTARADGSP